jgi:hypothetical protein
MARRAVGLDERAAPRPRDSASSPSARARVQVEHGRAADRAHEIEERLPHAVAARPGVRPGRLSAAPGAFTDDPHRRDAVGRRARGSATTRRRVRLAEEPFDPVVEERLAVELGGKLLRPLEQVAVGAQACEAQSVRPGWRADR